MVNTKEKKPKYANDEMLKQEILRRKESKNYIGDNFIPNTYNVTTDVDWHAKFLPGIRTHLHSLVKDIMEKFDDLAVARVGYGGKKTREPSIYSGSTGVLWGLYRYRELLEKEGSMQKPHWLD